MTDAAWTWDGAEVVPRETVVDLCLDGPVLDQLHEARVELARAQKGSDSLDTSDVEAAQARVDDLEEQARAATRPFTVRQIPWPSWSRLLDEHPSDDPDKRWNPATFVPAALHACCSQFPTLEAAVDAVGKLSTQQVARLFRAVLFLHEGEDPVPPTSSVSSTTSG